jgi:hypothetical protein
MQLAQRGQGGGGAGRDAPAIPLGFDPQRLLADAGEVLKGGGPGFERW